MTLIDALAEDGGSSIAALTALYTTVLRRMPAAWRFLYSSWDRLPGMESFRLSWMTRRFRHTEEALLRLNPDIILTTHPLATAIASRMKSRGLRSRLVAVFGDWHFQRFWCFPQVDQYLVSAPRQREGLIGIGVDPGRVTLSGMLVAPAYRARVPAAEARALLDLPPDRPVVLVTGGGRGWGLEALLRAIVQLPRPICTVVLCSSTERRSRLERLLARTGGGAADIRLLAFVPDPAPYYHAADLIVNKAGGISNAQAFACGTPVLAASPEPGHEEANLAELTRHGVVLVPRAGEDLTAAIDRFLDEPAALAEAAARGRLLVSIDTESIALAVLAGTAPIEQSLKTR